MGFRPSPPPSSSYCLRAFCMPSCLTCLPLHAICYYLFLFSVSLPAFLFCAAPTTTPPTTTKDRQDGCALVSEQEQTCLHTHTFTTTYPSIYSSFI